MNAPAPTALIAEDEPLLAAALQAELARAWPELKVVASVGDGLSAAAVQRHAAPLLLALREALNGALQIAPLEPLSARLVQTSYQAVLSPDGIASYRLRARFVIEDSARAARLARIGLRGTAKLFGDRAPLGYYLFRRPLASLRQWTGW